MALSAQQQVRHAYVGDTGLATPDIAAIKAAGEKSIGIASADGTAAAAGEAFKVYSKFGGEVIASPIIDPSQVSYAKSLQFVAQTAKKITFASVAAPVAGTLYTVSITMVGYGSLSPEDEYVKKAFYQSVTGDAAGDVTDGLIASLNRNFSREVGATATANPYFTFENTAGGLVITEKISGDAGNWVDKYYVVGKKDGHALNFIADITNTVGEITAQTVTGGVVGVGTGHDVASMEWYLKGERNDFYREAGYPHNLENTYSANALLDYNLIEIGFWKEGRDEAKKSKQQVTIAISTANLADNVQTNNLIADLNTILGAGSVAVLPLA